MAESGRACHRWHEAGGPIQSPGGGPGLAGAAPIWQNGREPGTVDGSGTRSAGIAGRRALVNLNTASLEELMTLKGIGIIPGRGYHPLPEGSRRFYKNRRYHEGAGHQEHGLSENKRKYYSIGNR